MRKPWAACEVALLRDIYPDVPAADVAALLARPLGSVYQAAAILGLKKSAAFHLSDASGRVQRGKQDPRMMGGRFQPGSAPWNKGGHFVAGGRSQETRFKPGNKPQTTLPVGSYRINADGHLQRKIGEAPGNNSQRWRGVAELVWIAANGPLPPGHIVIFKPGMRTIELAEITLDIVECISRAENARRNYPANKYPELAPLIQLKGAITRGINRRLKAAQAANTVNHINSPGATPC